ncbi:MAG TPA: hypothetical protein ENG74_03210, partial [Thermoplasmatales archaeon]|nr:hypothetical protein [Thermoplasmatales archaeon]
REPGVDYNRTLNITIEPASLEGIIYDDVNNNSIFDDGIDVPLSNAYVTIQDRISMNQYLAISDENGHYNFSNIFPSIYEITVKHNEIEIYRDDILFLSPGENVYNITKPKPARIEGTAYYDRNENGEYDEGEELSNVNVTLIYPDGERVVSSIITNETGHYMFDNVTPGDYRLNATVYNESTGRMAYAKEIDIHLDENQTEIVNISVELMKIKVSGYTIYDGSPQGSVSLIFSPANVENNTAEMEATLSNETTGSYEVLLKPGIYTVTASADVFDSETNTTIHYGYTGEITIYPGQAPLTNFDIILSEEE